MEDYSNEALMDEKYLYHKALAIVGRWPISRKALFILLEDKQMVDYLLKKNKGYQKDSSFEDEILVLEDEYKGEREVVSQSQRMYNSIRGVLTKPLYSVLETHFPPYLEPISGYASQMEIILDSINTSLTMPMEGKLWDEYEDSNYQ